MQQSGTTNDARELWPRDFGRDGVSGLVTVDRAMRARDVSRPDLEDEQVAEEVIDELLARIDGRRPPTPGGSRGSSSWLENTPTPEGSRR